LIRPITRKFADKIYIPFLENAIPRGNARIRDFNKLAMASDAGGDAGFSRVSDGSENKIKEVEINEKKIV
jgi:hypothetical protein